MDYYYVQVVYKYIVNFTSEIYILQVKCTSVIVFL
jgi:hypothetical protein